MPISEVYNTDCLEYMKTIPDKFFDLCIADPPYGINKAFSCTSRIAKYGQVVTVNDYKPSPELIAEIRRVSKNCIIWGYNHLADLLGATSNFIYWFKHQPVLSYASGELAYTDFKKTARCFDYPYYGNINADKYRIHPTQKPIALYNWILDNYAIGGGKIFDPFLGSGSSRIAAYMKGFDFYGCELDKTYFDAQEERFRRECFGERKMKNGAVVVQESLF